MNCEPVSTIVALCMLEMTKLSQYIINCVIFMQCHCVFSPNNYFTMQEYIVLYKCTVNTIYSMNLPASRVT